MYVQREMRRKCKHSYKDYIKLIPGWLIKPSPRNEVSKYWTWFISNFKEELRKLYGYEIPVIKRISRKDAILSLADENST